MSGPEGVPRAASSVGPSLFIIRSNDNHCIVPPSSSPLSSSVISHSSNQPTPSLVAIGNGSSGSSNGAHGHNNGGGGWRMWGRLEYIATSSSQLSGNGGVTGEVVCELRDSIDEGATKNGNGGVVIGRDPLMCSLMIRDERVSLHHCRLSYDIITNDVYIDDWSTNGTYINGRRLGDGSRTLLHDNDRISFVLSCEPELFEIALRFRSSPDKRAAIAAAGGGSGTVGELHRMARLRDDQKLEGATKTNKTVASAASLHTQQQPPILERTLTKPYKTDDGVMEDALSCPICSEILYKAVTIAPCGHRYFSIDLLLYFNVITLMLFLLFGLFFQQIASVPHVYQNGVSPLNPMPLIVHYAKDQNQHN
jgi:hypothetical protein